MARDTPAELLADVLRVLLRIDGLDPDEQHDELLHADLLQALLDGGYLTELALAQHLERSGWSGYTLDASEDEAVTGAEAAEIAEDMNMVLQWGGVSPPDEALAWGTAPKEN